MRTYLTPLLFFQRFFLPVLICLVLWAVWRTVWRKDTGVGLALYLGLIVIVDGFLNTGIYLPGLEKGSIRYSELCSVFLLFDRPPAPARGSGHGTIRLLVGLYFGLLFLSVFRAENLMASLFEFRRLIVPQVVSFVLTMRGVRLGEDFRRFALSVMAISIVMALFVFWDLFFDYWLLKSDSLSAPIYWMNRRQGRYGSFFLNPNYMGAFTVLLFPTLFLGTLVERGRLTKVLSWVGLLALVFCLVETQSRGPMLAFGISLVLLLVGPAGAVSRAKRLKLFLAFAMLFAIVMPGFIEHAIERFVSIDQEMTTESARTRETIWAYTRRAIADNPLTGIGFGETQFLHVINGKYEFEQDYGETSLDNPHNSYLQMTVYAGLPVLAVFLLMNFLLLQKGMAAIRRARRGQPAYEIYGLCVGIAGFLAVIYPDMHMFAQTVAPIYWMLFGLLLGGATTVRQTDATQSAAVVPARMTPVAPVFARRSASLPGRL